MTLKMIQNLLKVELHLHLDGSVSLELASKLLNKPVETLKKEMIAKRKCKNLSEYLTKFELPISIMQTKKNLEMIASDLVNNLAKENIIYAEIRFAPMFHTKKGLSYDDVVKSVLKGLKSNSSVTTNLILCLMRGMSDNDNLTTIDIAKKYLNKGVCGIDLAGDEATYPLSNYTKYFKIAAKEHIPFTIHAGEVGIDEEIEEAIKLGAKRIGHGIHCIKNEKIIECIKANNILLEICPTSNIQTNSIDTYKNHPIKKIYNKNILISINTDNTTVSNISLSKEYMKLYKQFNFTISNFKKINIDSLNHAFIDNDRKEKLMNKLLINYDD